MRPLRPDTMASRVFALLLVGIVLAAALAFEVSSLQARAAAAGERELRLADRIADAAATLASAPADARPDRFGVGPEALRPAGAVLISAAPDTDLTDRVARRIGTLAKVEMSQELERGCGASAAAPPPPPPSAASGAPGAPAPRPPSPPDAVATPPPGPPPATCRLVRLRLPGAAPILLTAPSGPRPPSPDLPFGPGPLLAAALAAGGLAWVTARLAVSPLTRLAEAARALGEDLDRPPLAPEGPREVRQAAAAFNAMQSRLRRGLEERTHMLAAITHDLQTPLTRQRLRLEKIADADLRERLLADQEAMRVLIREGLDLARAAHGGEDAALVDVDALLDSLAQDAVAAGQTVCVSSLCGCAVRAHPQALRRALANLLDNALTYAGAAEIAAARVEAGVIISVLDRGPGLRPDELEAMLEPFRRGEASRSRETGGAGLGLAIARMLAERCRAELRLRNRQGGGLEARLLFAAA